MKSMGLTESQFDVIATLGNTEGMTCKELGERTLITKGTLTGVVDRLEAKKIVRRVASPSDGRCQIVQLTKAGDALFAKVFPAHLNHVEQVFADFSQKDLDRMEATLQQLKEAFLAGNIQKAEAA